MQITKEQIELANQAFEKIDPEYEIEIVDLEVGDEEVKLSLPRDTVDLKTEDFLLYINEINGLDISKKRVRSPLITQIPIIGHDFALDVLIERYKLEYNNDGIRIRLIDNPILIGVGAVTLGEYSKYCPPCSSYSAVEVIYSTADKKFTEESEMKLIKSFLFEYSNISGQAIDFYEIRDSYWEGYEEEEEIEVKDIKIEVLPQYTEGMDLFVKALGTFDSEISFLYNYKIIEYYAPISAKILAHETLTRKLDSIRVSGANSKDLTAILSIAEQYRNSQTDKELAQSLLSHTVDIVDTFPKLPESIQKNIAKSVGFNKTGLSYTTKPETLQQIINVLGSILYSTRNSIVHAKSNYKSDKNECPKDDLAQLNDFLKHVTYSIINWHNRLPGHIKTDG